MLEQRMEAAPLRGEAKHAEHADAKAAITANAAL
jgi:hypothetical protein